MQTITTRFHRSMYITLGLACACLGYAELAFLPEMSVFAVFVGVLLVVAYYEEGRWALSIRGANMLGCAIAAIAAVWVAFQFVRPSGALNELPWPTGLLPYLGPLLMILIPAKLFRPKHDGDFWGLQGIGLIAVALACALTGDPLFGVLLFAYLTSGLWSLILFYYYRLGRMAGGAAGRVASAPRSLTQAGRWAVLATIPALTLFLCTPRVTEARWELSSASGKLQTGVDENRPVIDLNHSGTLTVNRDKVIEVHASLDRDGRIPKLDLDPNQRWRQMAFNSYENGRWDNRPGEPRFPSGGLNWRGLDQPRQNSVTLADLGPGQFFLLFSSHNRSVPLLRAEPIAHASDADGRPLPTVVNLTRSGREVPWNSVEGELSPPISRRTAMEYTYKQVTRLTPEPGIAPAFLSRSPESGELDHLRDYQAVPRLTEWTRGLVARLVAQGRLPPDLSRIEAAGQINPDEYEIVCRAFEDYLAHGPEFKYTLNLTRQDPRVDPIEDFVINIKKGHCSRFATALTLMLRSVGVPTRIVLGYRGYETTDDGVYEVLQCHAHAWVEALIVRPSATPGEREWRWMTLDPTPSTEDVEAGEFSWSHWWEFTRQQVAVLFKDFIIEYDADQQDRTRSAIAQSNWQGVPRASQRMLLGESGDDWTRATIIGVTAIGIALGVRWTIRRLRPVLKSAIDPATAFYPRLVAAVGRAFGLIPLPGQTPREFALAAGERLRFNEMTRDFAEVPSETAILYYRVRFGEQPLEPSERSAIDARLDRLELALASTVGG
jgi:transglutaminase-like putative cysteine protease